MVVEEFADEDRRRAEFGNEQKRATRDVIHRDVRRGQCIHLSLVGGSDGSWLAAVHPLQVSGERHDGGNDDELKAAIVDARTQVG